MNQLRQLFFFCGISLFATASAYAQIKAEDLVGNWLGEGYYCPPGRVDKQQIRIDVYEGRLVATKTVGDACITSGEVTWSGVLENGRIVGKIRGASPGQRRQSFDFAAEVVSPDLLRASEGITYTRGELSARDRPSEVWDNPCRGSVWDDPEKCPPKPAPPKVVELRFVARQNDRYEAIEGALTHGQTFYLEAEFESEPDHPEHTVSLSWTAGTGTEVKVKPTANPVLFRSDPIRLEKPAGVQAEEPSASSTERKDGSGKYVSIDGELRHGSTFYVEATFDAKPTEDEYAVQLSWGEGAGSEVKLTQSSDPTVFRSEAIRLQSPPVNQ